MTEWEAVRTDDEDETDPRFPWQPCLADGGTTVPLRLWFATERECLAFIATIPAGEPR